jgi:hypothetical protein
MENQLSTSMEGEQQPKSATEVVSEEASRVGGKTGPSPKDKSRQLSGKMVCYLLVELCRN